MIMTENPYAAPEYVPQSAEMAAEVPEAVLTRVSAGEVIRAVHRHVRSMMLLKAVLGVAVIAVVVAVAVVACTVPFLLFAALDMQLGGFRALAFALLAVEVFLVLPVLAVWTVVWLLRYFDALLRGDAWWDALWITCRKNRRRTLHMTAFALLFGGLPCGIWAVIVTLFFWAVEAVHGVKVSFLLPLNAVVVPVDVWLVLLCPGLWLTAVHGVPFVQAGKMTLRLVKMNFRTFALLTILVAAVLGAAGLWDALMWEMFGFCLERMPLPFAYYLSTPGQVLIGVGWTLAGAYVLFFYPIFCMMACGGKKNED